MELIEFANIKKILVLKLDHIGDLVLATPVFRAIKDLYPDIELDALVSSGSFPVIKNSPFINKIYTYDADQFDRYGIINSITKQNNFQSILETRKNHYDLCINLREDDANIAIMNMLAAKINISFINDTIYRELLDAYVVQNKKKHAAASNFDLLKIINISKPKVIKPEIFVSEEDLHWTYEFLNNNKLHDNDIKIGVSIGGGWFLNWWPYKKYVELCQKLCHYNKKVKIIFIGGKAEEALWGNITTLNPERYISAMGRTSITQLAALSNSMDLFITNDGGPMHIVSTADKPIIALFGPSPSRRFGPLGKHNVIITKNFKCSPCPQFEHGKVPECKANRCMDSITVDEVFKAAIKIIDTIRKG
ncbi:glycosyltransferase family 9 protein [Anaerocolumna jejuensis]|uniref:glycosyltransferase family 9 protein n=1 Tax=Anaerocolumna jejuensis TaxID=259063 RepID=UPI003F7C8F82